jgi:hypothetical protein
MRSRSRYTKPDEELPPWVDSIQIQGEEFPGCI